MYILEVSQSEPPRLAHTHRHRAALDFDKNFIINSITADDFNFEEIEFRVKRGRGWKRERTSGGELA
jgi:hypothetical protein